jgi:lipoprotein NlpD
MRAIHGWLTGVVFAVVLGGCARTGLAPVVTHAPEAEAAAVVNREGQAARTEPAVGRPPGYHSVVRGDTLYAIAFRYGLDYRVVAQWNGLTAPFTIFPGQRILLRAPPPARIAPAHAAPPNVTVPARRAASGGDTAAPESGRSVDARAAESERSAIGDSRFALAWRWPTRGTVRDAPSPFGRRGIQIIGHRGQIVEAAAGGQVVYSGSGLIGYGKLIIIKHNDEFLSAYAHNEKLLVAEGDSVAAGQKIAEMGDSGAKQVMLHFEIRRDGKPVSPLEYLPKS